MGYNTQERLLKEGVDIAIGTPGRLMDFGNSGKIKFKDFSILVIDEADRMFDMGFFPDIRRMLKKMNPPGQRISLLFSATMSLRVKNLAWEYMNEPMEINMSPENITVDKINQTLYHVNTREKISLLLGILKKHNPQHAIVFTNTKRDAMKVASRLAGNGYNCDYIIGDLPQSKRSKIIENVKSGKLKFLVATDVAARGLHVDDLDMVINYDVPEDYENYVHRIGRTARAGKSGQAITMACEKFVYGIEPIENYIKMKIPIDWAGDDLYIKDESTPEFLNSYLKNSNRKPIEKRKSDGSRTKKTGTAAGNRRSAVKTGGASAAKNDVRRNERKAPAGKNQAAASAKKSTAKTKNRAVAKAAPKRTASARLPENATLEERMEFYKERYGENFTVTRETATGDAKRNTVKKSSPQKVNKGKAEAVKKKTSRKPAVEKAKTTPKKTVSKKTVKPKNQPVMKNSGSGRLEDKGLLSSIITLFRKKK